MYPLFNATVKDGQLHIHSSDRFREYLRGLNGEVQLRVSKPKRGRSESQNNYYWVAVVRIAGQHFGYNDQEMHEAYKWLFLRREEPGKPLTIGSTAAMTVGEFVKYVDQCRQWCAEQGVNIPDPSSIEI